MRSTTGSFPEVDVPEDHADRGATLWALATGAGKDATLALHRARSMGREVRYGLNVYEGNTDRVRFHGTRKELVEAHGRHLDLEMLMDHTHPREYEPVFTGLLDALRERGVDGVLFGNLHLTDVRAWYEERTVAAGLRHLDPLWEEDPGAVAREFVGLGYRAVVVSVDLERGDPDWLGRELDRGLIRAIESRGADPCGEHGEYHTFVWDGPAFREPVPFRRGEEVEMEGHRLLDLLPRS